MDEPGQTESSPVLPGVPAGVILQQVHSVFSSGRLKSLPRQHSWRLHGLNHPSAKASFGPLWLRCQPIGENGMTLILQ